MRNAPLVSVVVPMYNKGRYIKRTLDSILTQTFSDFELLVIDDGSTDDGPDAVTKYRDARLTMYRQQNAGPGAARNAGLRAVVGRYVAFIDADDEWLPNYLEHGVSFLNGAREDIATVSFGCREPHKSAGEVSTFWDQKGLMDGMYSIQHGTSPELFDSLLAFMSPCSTIARTKVVRKYGGFFDRYRCLYAEDAFLWLKVLLNEKVAVNRDVRVIVHSEASGLSGNLTAPREIEPFLLSPEEIYSFCPAEKKVVLAELLSIRASRTAFHYAVQGHKGVAKELIRKFCREYPKPLTSKIFFAVHFAPVMPFLLKLWFELRR